MEAYEYFVYLLFSLVCMTLYRHGCLSSYMTNRPTPLSDAALHNITLDVANGLEFIHQQCILHNALTSEAIYVASVSEVCLHKVEKMQIFSHEYDRLLLKNILSKRFHVML